MSWILEGLSAGILNAFERVRASRRRVLLANHRSRLLAAVDGGTGLRLEGWVTVIHPERLKLGNDVYIGADSYLNCAGGLEIKDHAVLSRNVVVYSYDHNFKRPSMLPYDVREVARPVRIGRYVWVGMNAIIAPGTVIGDGAVLGIGVVVSGEVPPNAVVVSAKHRIVGYRDPEQAQRLMAEGRFLTNWLDNARG